ncbi:MAG: polyhydroxybutyrate depolymerase [Myxococcota bacterium]|jgi:polyhydroxybutyrate depolymerase
MLRLHWPIYLVFSVLFACGGDGTEAIRDSTVADTDAGSMEVTEDTQVAEDATDAQDSLVEADTVASFEVPAPTQLGDARPARVKVPLSYDGQTALPAVILLGGYDYLAQDLDDWVRISSEVDGMGLVLLMPDGLIDSDGSPYWNATDTCCDFFGSGVDDVGYLTALLDALTSRVNVDPARIYLLGHSNGGFMAYRMACEVADRIAGIVSIAGSGWLSETDCKASEAVSVLQVHGLADDVMPFGGDSDAPGALEMTRRWGVRAGCDPSSWAELPAALELVDDGISDETTVSTFGAGCDPTTNVTLWAMRGNDHYPEFRERFTREALTWLLAQ